MSERQVSEIKLSIKGGHGRPYNMWKPQTACRGEPGCAPAKCHRISRDTCLAHGPQLTDPRPGRSLFQEVLGAGQKARVLVCVWPGGQEGECVATRGSGRRAAGPRPLWQAASGRSRPVPMADERGRPLCLGPVTRLLPLGI